MTLWGFYRSGWPGGPYRIVHLSGPPSASGGGTGSLDRRRPRKLEKAIEIGIERLTNYADRTPHDRILIRRRKPSGEHPTWLYRDGDGKVCVWRRHESQKLEGWGSVS